MSPIPIYSVVAWSGTGKTTLLEKLIPRLKEHGLRLAVIKHDAHKFDIDKEGKDSYRLTKAGSDMTIIASDNKAVIMENRYITTEELITHVHDVDMILTEGYKHGDWLKVLVHRSATGKPPVLEPEKCFAIMSDIPLSDQVPSFGLDDIKELAALMLEDLKRRSGAGTSDSATAS